MTTESSLFDKEVSHVSSEDRRDDSVGSALYIKTPQQVASGAKPTLRVSKQLSFNVKQPLLSMNYQYFSDFFQNIRFEYLPAYSPELNPVEQCWQWIKKVKLANRASRNDKEHCHNVKSVI